MSDLEEIKRNLSFGLETREDLEWCIDRIMELTADVAILTNNNEALERDDKIIRAHVVTLEAQIKDLKIGHNKFNHAINHAVDHCSPFETRDFLQFWQEGDWDACREFDFDPKQEGE